MSNETDSRIPSESTDAANFLADLGLDLDRDDERAATGRRNDRLTYKGNLSKTRHGWLRLTPAHSVHLVSRLLDDHCFGDSVVLDPFCGTGTTALVCAERGIECDTTDINPFLVWLARVKTSSYSPAALQECKQQAATVVDAIRALNVEPPWTPPLHQVEKWWSSDTLAALGRAMAVIRALEPTVPDAVTDLLKVAFCRAMIAHANVSFGHQSMSFKARNRDHSSPLNSPEAVVETWVRSVGTIIDSAASCVQKLPSPILCDARDLRQSLPLDRFDCVITSPPYANRMSYIRELRPYMYWLGYLRDGREAGELDWQAIGGTWGSATSKLGKWIPDRSIAVPFAEFDDIVARISARSLLLGQYVSRYVQDMLRHCQCLYTVVRPGGTAHYIIGNSKFYDVLLPVETIFVAIFESVGFTNPNIEVIRKRSSKKELFEFVVSVRKPC